MANINRICLVVAIGGLLFGFDTAVISGVIGPLRADFVLNSSLEGWVVSSGLLGCILGVIVTGVVSNRIGRKKTVLISAALFFLSGIGCASAGTIGALTAARMVGGAGVGIASVICPMIIAEFAVAEKRGRMIAYYQLAITIGILLAYFSNALLLVYASHNFQQAWAKWFFSEETWRPMFLAMCIPSILFFILLWAIPESPRWLLSIGRREHSLKILKQLMGDQEANLQFMNMDMNLKKADSKSTPLFSKQFRIPLLIGVVLAVFQQFSGINAIIYYGPGIFQTAGIDTTNALLFQVIIGAVNLLSTFIAIQWSDKYGRKFLLKIGLVGIVVSLSWMGFLFYTGYSGGYLILILMLLFIICFAFSLGPVTWIIINEIFPIQIRVKAVSICTLALWMAVWTVGQFFPWMLENTGAAVTFWIFAGFSLVNFIFCWKIVQETSGRSLEDMDQVFLAPH